MLSRLPITVAAGCVSIYWLAVVVKCILIVPKIGRLPNVIPHEQTGRFLRLIWVPLILAWIVEPWRERKWLPDGDVELILGSCGAVMCMVALTLTFYCWHQMGTSWRIGIDPREKTALVVTGAFRHVRHPIYALSILLMLGTLASVPTAWMAAIAATHIVLLQIEARREEKYLLLQHGTAYDAYCATANRFIPGGFGR